MRDQLSNWLGTFTTNLLILLVSLATGMLVARLLGPDGRGALATIVFWPSLFSAIGLMSLPAALVYRRGNATTGRTIISSTSILLCVVLIPLCLLIGNMILPFVLQDPALMKIARIFMFVFVPLHFLATILLAIIQSDLRFNQFNISRLVPNVVYLAGLLFLWASQSTNIETVAWATLVGTFFTVIIRLHFARNSFWALPTFTEARALLENSLRFHGGNIFSLIYSQADRFVVIILWDSKVIGLYVVAYTLASAGLGTISMAFRDLLFPRLAVISDKKEQKSAFEQTLRFTTLLLLPAAILVAILSPWLLPFLFGNAFSGAVNLCLLLVVAYVPATIRDIISSGLRGTGEWKACVYAEAIALVTFSLTVWPLASAFEVLGVPIALIIANLFSIIYLFFLISIRFDLTLKDVWGLHPNTIKEFMALSRARFKDLRS